MVRKDLLTLGIFAKDTIQNGSSLAVLGHDAAKKAQGYGEEREGSSDAHIEKLEKSKET